MPLDFPSSPTNGQTYENFVYDSSITAWRNQGSPSGLGGAVATLQTNVAELQAKRGKILQVVQGSVNTSYSTNQYTWISTGLSATITPKYATSQILIIATQNGCGKAGGDTTLQLRLMRDSSVLDYFATGGAWTQSSAVNFGQTMGGNFIDSPATTSAVTYSTQFSAYSPNNGSVYVQYGAYGNPTSRIILMEIAA